MTSVTIIICYWEDQLRYNWEEITKLGNEVNKVGSKISIEIRMKMRHVELQNSDTRTVN